MSPLTDMQPTTYSDMESYTDPPMTMIMDKDDLWVVEHFSELVTKYAGKYVAVVNETLVAVGDSRRDVETKAREVEPKKIPSVLKVPREEDMVCLLSNSRTRFTKAT
jgi:Family of unknown function (DUF5678)